MFFFGLPYQEDMMSLYIYSKYLNIEMKYLMSDFHT